MIKDPDFLKAISHSLFGKITVKNVLESHIWLIGVLTLFITIMSILHVSLWVIGGIFLLLAVLVGYYMYSHNYFMRKKPEYLRSETFQLQKQQLEMLGRKGKEVPAEEIIQGKSIKQLPKPVKKKKTNNGK